MSTPPLQGIRVLDFSGWYAVPVAATALAVAGAEVIRIETSKLPDTIGRYQEQGRIVEVNPKQLRGKGFSEINQNKRCISLNLRAPEGVDIAKRLAALSDVVVTSYRPGTMERLGLGYDELRRRNPGIIMFSESGMGSIGPEKGYAGYASIFSAVGGLSHITGYPQGFPTEVRASSDIRTGNWGALALLVAIFYRAKTGHGQFIDLAATEGISCLIGDVIMERPLTGHIPSRQANRHASMAPHGVYRCQGDEAWISIAVATQEEWEALCTVAQHPEWAEDPRFADSYARWVHQEALDELLNQWTTTQNKFDLMHLLQKAGVAAAPSYSSMDLSEDPHLKERSVWQPLPFPGRPEETVTVIKWPWQRLSRSKIEIERGGPLLGEDNHYVYGELLGLSAEEIARLEEADVID